MFVKANENKKKKHKLKIKETITNIFCDEGFLPAAKQEILLQRRYLEDYIQENPSFRLALEPYEVSPDAPEIIKRMANSAAKAGVGPMASVAGAIAEYAVKAMVDAGAAHAVVDNGGDIAMFLNHPIVVGIYAGESEIDNLGLRFIPEGVISGICTSSATVGPSLSFGKADAAVVLSKDVIFADAVATSLGNAITQKNQKLIEKAMDSHMMENIEGLIVLVEDIVGMCGELPDIVKIDMDYNLITRG
ncbi:UPF0280 family protein [Acidobacteriota bacterium]